MFLSRWVGVCKIYMLLLGMEWWIRPVVFSSDWRSSNPQLHELLGLDSLPGADCAKSSNAKLPLASITKGRCTCPGAWTIATVPSGRCWRLPAVVWRPIRGRAPAPTCPRLPGERRCVCPWAGADVLFAYLHGLVPTLWSAALPAAAHGEQ